MPLRAFIDSDQPPVLVNRHCAQPVLMPLRAFIDSDPPIGLIFSITAGGLNALTGIYWFGPGQHPLRPRGGVNRLNALTGIYWFGPLELFRTPVSITIVSLNALTGIYWFGRTLFTFRITSGGECLNALTGIYWFGLCGRNFHFSPQKNSS